MNKTLLENLLKKYSQGACSPEECAIIESWLATVKSSNSKCEDSVEAETLKLVKSRLNAYLNKGHKRTKIKFSYLSAAASVLLAACLGWLHFKPKEAVVINSRPKSERYVKNGFIFLKTPKGFTQTVNLPDGSRVTMDAATSLHYPVKFIKHTRPVYLDEGQALFNVAKDAKNPFTVYAGKFATTALGTAFNIRNYAVENKVSVSLIHGKIRVDDLRSSKKNMQSKFLLPHQQLVFNKPAGTLTQSVFTDEAPVLSWTDGVLYFKDAGAPEVLNAIDNKFNVLIINRSSHVKWSYTGVFKNESLTDVLKTICLTESITYTINKQTITLN